MTDRILGILIALVIIALVYVMMFALERWLVRRKKPKSEFRPSCCAVCGWPFHVIKPECTVDACPYRREAKI